MHQWRTRHLKRKQPSKRRWKARWRLGKPVPWLAIAEHDLYDMIKNDVEYNPLSEHVRRTK